MWIIAIICIYFAALMLISRFTQRRADNQTFFRAGRRSPWYMVAFGMVGASISGVTFVSVPGMVLSSQMTYLQVCLGFIVGYLVVAFVLLPVYYKLNLTSIYMYLGMRLGRHSYQAGAWFFLLSKIVGAAIKFYVVCMVLQQFVFDALGIPFVLSVLMLVLLIWLYTRKGGVRTLVFTDVFQTLCLFTALLLIIYMVVSQLDFSLIDAFRAVGSDERSRVFVFDDWTSPHYFWKQFLSGAFIVIVMTGLDQDMMQKNLTCRTLREAQKDMCSYGVAFVPVNLLFLALGVLLAQLFERQGLVLPTMGDELLPQYVEQTPSFFHLASYLFVLGIVAASFSSADSALTSLTTSYCVDIRGKAHDEQLRKQSHLVICLLFAAMIILFHLLNSKSLIDAIYTIVSYTYGPLLGLFGFGLFTKRQVCDNWTPVICLASPFVCYAIDQMAQTFWEYHFGYELLMLNGLLTFLGLWLLSRSAECQSPS
jgi:Na+/proline symporter